MMTNNDKMKYNFKEFFKKYSIAIIVFFICIFFIVHQYVSSLNEFDKKIVKCDEFYNKIIPPDFLKNIIALSESRLDETTSGVISLLKNNGFYESIYLAMLFTREAVVASNSSSECAKKLFSAAKKFSPDYQKSYFYEFIFLIYNFEIYNGFKCFLELLYLIFISPAAIFQTMIVILAAFVSFIFAQIIYFAAMYIKYRRLLKHEAHEFQIDVASISINPYLDEIEKKFMSFLNKNLMISLLLVVFFCYFSTGFGKHISVVYDANEFIKNAAEFRIMNGFTFNENTFADFEETIKNYFQNEKNSRDFYYYFAYSSRLVSKDRSGALQYYGEMPASSFLVNKLKSSKEISFLSDADIYRAFFSPIRSNPLFMIAVLLNVLMIIIFSGIIKRARYFTSGAKAELCACGVISCSECRVHIGLCNACLMPLKNQNQSQNIIKNYYQQDKNKIYYMSLIFPGLSYFYFSQRLLALFYSMPILFFTLIDVCMLSGSIKTALKDFFILPMAVYLIYAIESYFFMKNTEFENESHTMAVSPDKV